MIRQIRKYWIYVYTHRTNGKRYVGYTKNLKRRQRDHRQQAKTEPYKFYHAVRAHGWQAFDFTVYEEVFCCEVEAKAREVELIAEWKTLEEGYNSTKGGDGQACSEEVRAKMSHSQRTSPKAIAGRSKVWVTRRQNYTQEEISSMVSRQNQQLTPEQKAAKTQKLRSVNLSRPTEQEAERQRKRAATVASRSPEKQAQCSANLSAGIKSRILSEESQAKIAAGCVEGGKISGARVREQYMALTPEQKIARQAKITEGTRRAAATRTQEQKDEITRKRLESRARNKAALLEGKTQ